MHANHYGRGYGKVYAWVRGIWENKGAIIISLSHLSRVSIATSNYIFSKSTAWSLLATLFDGFF